MQWSSYIELVSFLHIYHIHIYYTYHTYIHTTCKCTTENPHHLFHNMGGTLATTTFGKRSATSKATFPHDLPYLSGICFTPDSDAILDELNAALEGIISAAQQAPRIVFMRAFAPYFEGKPSGLNPPSIIRATAKFQVCVCVCMCVYVYTWVS